MAGRVSSCDNISVGTMCSGTGRERSIRRQVAACSQGRDATQLRTSVFKPLGYAAVFCSLFVVPSAIRQPTGKSRVGAVTVRRSHSSCTFGRRDTMQKLVQTCARSRRQKHTLDGRHAFLGRDNCLLPAYSAGSHQPAIDAPGWILGCSHAHEHALSAFSCVKHGQRWKGARAVARHRGRNIQSLTSDAWIKGRRVYAARRRSCGTQAAGGGCVCTAIDRSRKLRKTRLWCGSAVSRLPVAAGPPPLAQHPASSMPACGASRWSCTEGTCVLPSTAVALAWAQ